MNFRTVCGVPRSPWGRAGLGSMGCVTPAAGLLRHVRAHEQLVRRRLGHVGPDATTGAYSAVLDEDDARVRGSS